MKVRNLFILISGSSIIILLILFNVYTKNYFQDNNRVMDYFHRLKQKELSLNYELEKTNIYLYRNLDTIPLIERDIDLILEKFEKIGHLKTQHYNIWQEFLIYKKLIHKKIDMAYKIETLEIPIKNSAIYLAELLQNIQNSNIDKNYKNLVLKIVSDIFLAKTSFDKSFIFKLKERRELLNKFKFKDEKMVKFNETLIRNIELIENNFPIFVYYMGVVNSFRSVKQLKKMEKDFFIFANKELKVITYVSIVLILFTIVVLGLIFILLIKIDKEKESLEKMLKIDDLTGLFNRRQLEKDIIKQDEAILLLVNIDRFKYYNDIYGIKVGDFILKEVGKNLKELLSQKVDSIFYRIGGDDFGILIKRRGIKIEDIAEMIIEYFKNQLLSYKNIEFHISVTIGISFEKPLIETADIILKETKKRKSASYGIYNKSIGYKERIEENMKNLTILKNAIFNKNIIPYYQPIFDNKTEKVIKYEVLARIIDNNKVLSIFPFLGIAKENKLYKNISQLIYIQAFEKFKDKEIDFSLNISLADIEEKETMELLDSLFEKYSNITQYLTFEILESEAVGDYNSLRNFIKKVKNIGISVAIDDFGSGYSNFAHILNLDIDYLKIDGSLIKEIDKDEKMGIIVETIVEFSKKVGMKTIAEFVSNQAIYKKVKEYKIDYTQGFYLGEPKGDLIGS